MKKKQKGFSLVEMIVTVLIIAVLAVALAPQVMKWVGVSEESIDSHSKDNLKATAQVAVAEFENKYGAEGLSDEEYVITSSGVQVVDGTENNPGMIAIMEQYLGGNYPKVKRRSGKVFIIRLQAEGRKITIKVVDGTY